MRLRFTLAAIVWVCGAFAQTTVSTAVQNASIRGTITDARSGQALADYVVSTLPPPLRDGSRSAAVSGRSDAAGRFSLSNLPPGRYTLSFGSGRTLPIASRIVTLAGQDIDALDVRLMAEGSISGNVVDELKEPVSGVTVWLVSREYYLGSVHYVFRAKTATDDKGMYTLRHVPAGRG
jgi:hypothetical protein